MTEPLPQSAPPRSSVWLGIAVGWVSQLCLKVILPMVVLFGARFWSQETDNPAWWLKDIGDSSHPLWFAMQAAVFVGSMAAGAIGARLAPLRSRALPVALVLLSLLATMFEQFPRPLTAIVQFVWIAGPCLGLLIGVWLIRRRMRRSARTGGAPAEAT